MHIGVHKRLRSFKLNAYILRYITQMAHLFSKNNLVGFMDFLILLKLESYFKIGTGDVFISEYTEYCSIIKSYVFAYAYTLACSLLDLKFYYILENE